MKQRKEIHKFDLKGNYLKSYKSIYYASKDLDIPRGTIYNSIYKYNIVRKKYYFSYKKAIDVLDMCLLNNPLMSEYTGNYDSNRLFRYKVIPDKECILGCKDETYLTESEMIIGYVAPGYKDLSKDEQKIWKELEKEKEVL